MLYNDSTAVITSLNFTSRIRKYIHSRSIYEPWNLATYKILFFSSPPIPTYSPLRPRLLNPLIPVPFRLPLLLVPLLLFVCFLTHVFYNTLRRYLHRPLWLILLRYSA